ncbi:hypothetical protein JW766_00255 [Candidatus Dojkabacteria bacterium]|nr:hypothetical protein [Candidatus Dojkabacteria bacterium]
MQEDLPNHKDEVEVKNQVMEKQNVDLPGKKRDKKKLVIIVLGVFVGLLFLLGLCIGIYFIYKSQIEEEVTEEEQEETSEVKEESSEEQEKDDAEEPLLPAVKKIAFVRRKGEGSEDDELWISDWDGTNQRSLGITSVSEVFNGPNEKWIFYKNYEEHILLAYNLETGRIKEIVETDTLEARAGIQGNNTISISPKEDVIIYEVIFFQKEDCVDICMEMDPYPERKVGFYAYNMVTDKKVYLGDFLMVANWDKDGQNIYTHAAAYNYHEYGLGEGIYKINVNTGDAQLIATSDEEVYVYHFLEEKNITFRHIGSIAEGTELFVEKGGVEKKLDEGEWAVLQPFIWISPGRRYVLYERKKGEVVPHQPHFELILVDLNTLEKRVVASPGANEKIASRNYWIDDDYFITLFEYGDFSDWYSVKEDLLLVNIHTGETTKITEFGDVMFF